MVYGRIGRCTVASLNVHAGLAGWLAGQNRCAACAVNGDAGDRQITGYQSVDDSNWHHFDITYLHDVNNPSINNFSLYIVS